MSLVGEWHYLAGIDERPHDVVTAMVAKCLSFLTIGTLCRFFRYRLYNSWFPGFSIKAKVMMQTGFLGALGVTMISMKSFLERTLFMIYQEASSGGDVTKAIPDDDELLSWTQGFGFQFVSVLFLKLRFLLFERGLLIFAGTVFCDAALAQLVPFAWYPAVVSTLVVFWSISFNHSYKQHQLYLALNDAIAGEDEEMIDELRERLRQPIGDQIKYWIPGFIVCTGTFLFNFVATSESIIQNTQTGCLAESITKPYRVMSVLLYLTVGLGLTSYLLIYYCYYEEPVAPKLPLPSPPFRSPNMASGAGSFVFSFLMPGFNSGARPSPLSSSSNSSFGAARRPKFLGRLQVAATGNFRPAGLRRTISAQQLLMLEMERSKEIRFTLFDFQLGAANKIGRQLVRAYALCVVAGIFQSFYYLFLFNVPDLSNTYVLNLKADVLTVSFNRNSFVMLLMYLFGFGLMLYMKARLTWVAIARVAPINFVLAREFFCSLSTLVLCMLIYEGPELDWKLLALIASILCLVPVGLFFGSEQFADLMERPTVGCCCSESERDSNAIKVE